MRLVELSLSINCKNEFKAALLQTDSDGKTPLHYAAKNGHITIILNEYQKILDADELIELIARLVKHLHYMTEIFINPMIDYVIDN